MAGPHSPLGVVLVALGVVDDVEEVLLGHRHHRRRVRRDALGLEVRVQGPEEGMAAPKGTMTAVRQKHGGGRA